jgi:transcriptional regulator with XRE-family HTH domain
MIGQVIKTKREVLGITQTRLSELILCKRTTISMIESDTRLPTRQQYNSLVKMLGLDEKKLKPFILSDIEDAIKANTDNYNLLKILNIVETI